MVFGVLNGLILRPLNVPQPERLYLIEHGRDKSTTLSYPDYLDLRDHNRGFDGLAASNTSEVGLDTGGNPSRAWGDEVSGNYFDVLGIQPYLQRFLPGVRRARPEQRSVYRAHLCLLAHPFSGRSRRSGPHPSPEQASFYHHRCSAAGVPRGCVVFLSRFLCAAG